MTLERTEAAGRTGLRAAFPDADWPLSSPMRRRKSFGMSHLHYPPPPPGKIRANFQLGQIARPRRRRLRPAHPFSRPRVPVFAPPDPSRAFVLTAAVAALDVRASRADAPVVAQADSSAILPGSCAVANVQVVDSGFPAILRGRG